MYYSIHRNSVHLEQGGWGGGGRGEAFAYGQNLLGVKKVICRWFLKQSPSCDMTLY